ncbi:MAG: ABC transporter substrate-binding protein [Actinobacteria bacterium]|nr:ABC transporter substrate-binding protein [Actinomycetota bacterium]
MRLRSTAALFTAIALVAGACGDGGEDVELGDAADDTATTGASPGETAGDDGGDAAEGGTLVAALGGEPDMLDPHKTSSSFAFKVLENVYDTLVQPGADLQMEPALAEDWETSDDLLTWTFTLRDGVTFHNGAELTAEDVKASYDRIIEEELNNAYRFASIEEIRAPDDRTVEIALTRPTPNLLTQIGAFKGMAILDSDDIEGGFDFEQEANGTGPFTLESFEPAQGIELAAFDGYWQDGLPLLDGVDFRFIPEESVKLTNLQSGDVDWIDTVAPERLDQLEGSDDVEVGRVAGNDYWYMATNIAREPFSDVNVRRAIAFALDPAQIARAAKLDAATPNETAIPETSFWYHEYAPFGQDVDQAQQLLDDAGQGDGFSMDLMVTNEFPETVQAAQAIASQLSEVGIQVEIRTLDFSTWLAEQGEGNFDSFMLGWLGNIDPDDFYYAQHHSEGGFNFHGYANPEVDELLEEARRETDQDTRKGLYDQVAELIVDDASYIYFYNPDIINAWSPQVSGYETRPDNAVRFVETSLGS